jgi:outer membrane scaffolding protein for murein synthesis (MipA/OmpV family)
MRRTENKEWGRRSSRPWPLARGLLWLSVTAGAAVPAQETQEFEAWARAVEMEESGESLEPGDERYVRDDWYVRIGVIGGAVPGYLGSSHYEGSYAPRAKIVWRDRVFLNDRQLGVNAYKDDRLAVGPFLRYTGGRSDSNDGLEGMGHVDRTLMAGGFLNYRLGPARFKSEVRTDVLDEGQGTLAIARLGARLPLRAPLFNVYLSTTWASAEHMRTFFGVDAGQSVRAGLDEYDADAGFRDVAVSLSGGHAFTERWSVGAQVEFQHLLGDAADSPLVEERGSPDQLVIGVGLNYTF